jgi:lambda family phage portal protein
MSASPPVATWLDRAIGVVAPRAMLARVEARFRAAAMSDARAAYDGASRGWRTDSRTISRSDANAEIRVSLPRLRDVHRDLVRNNPYAARAVSARVVNTVGAGIVPSVKSRSVRSRDAIKALVEAHLDKTAIDFHGRLNLYGLEALIERARSESGEAIILRRLPTAADMVAQGLKVPLQIEVLEGDFLDHTKHGYVGQNNAFVFMGVEFDASGRRAAYWLFDEHPNGRDLRRGSLLSRRVPASEVIHYYHMLRPGQVRGIPDGTPAIMPMWDLNELHDARVIREKIAACFVAFWTRGDQPVNLAQGAAANERAAGLAVRELAPGVVQEMPTGSEVQFGAPPATTGLAEFEQTSVRRIAMAYDISYEEVSCDLSDVSFLSGRLGEIHMARRVDQWQWHAHIPTVCDALARWFLDAASIVARVAPDLTLGWTPPRREMLSPKDEIPAKRDAIRAGLTSRQAEIRKLGDDPEEVDREQAEDNARADLARLQHDSDGRRPRQGPSETIVTPQGEGA